MKAIYWGLCESCCNSHYEGPTVECDYGMSSCGCDCYEPDEEEDEDVHGDGDEVDVEHIDE